VNILALETSSELCSVALMVDGEVFGREAPDRMHSTSVLPMLDALLAETGLALSKVDAVAFGRGPGMFTGLRIGAGIAQGIGFSAGLPVIPVSSLMALAASAEDGCVLAVQDARMGELYWAFFEKTGNSMELLGEETLGPASSLVLPDQVDSCYALGSGCAAVGDEISQRLGSGVSGCRADAWPRATDVARLASLKMERGLVSPGDALPVYLRNDVARKKGRGGS